MSKLNLFLVSLVAAIPGGVLSVILALNFLNSPEQMEVMLKVVSGFTLAISVIVTALPVGILIFGPKTESPRDEVRKESPSSASQPEVAVVAGPDSEVVIPSRDSGDVDATDSEMPNIDLGDDFPSESEMESVDFGADFDEEFDDEEEEPKGRKR